MECKIVQCGSGKRHQPMTPSINQGLHALAITCRHKLATSLSSNSRQHQSRHVLFEQAMSTNGKRHQLRDIGRRPPELIVSCCMSLSGRWHGLPASAMACAYCLIILGRELPASPLSCTQRLANVRCCMSASI